MAEHQKQTAAILRSAIAKLKAAGVETAALDARLLLQHVANISHKDILAGWAPDLSTAQMAAFAAVLKRRLAGEPVHRILGHRAFYRLDLLLAPHVLEPRPDTETLVDLLLPVIKAKAKHKKSLICLDMGTGSGAIALALLAQVPQLQAVGVDISVEALHIAQKNAENAGVAERFRTQQSDWFADINGRFDFIVSNPPYIASADIDSLPDDVRLYDPQPALDGGCDGLDFYRALARQAADYLAKDGKLAVEIGFDQGHSVINLFQASGFCLEASAKDLGGMERALLFGLV